MIIKNYDSLISRVKIDREIFARKSILEFLDIGINSVLPKNFIPKIVKLKETKLHIKKYQFALSKINKIHVVGAGKASGAMAEALERILKSYITDGFINVPEGTKSQYNTQFIQLNEASHPIPSESGLNGARKMINLLEKTRDNDLILVLLSGGGSALLPLPVESITLDQLQNLNEALIKSGATIQEINTVRKHCSLIKGGQLAKFGFPATIITLILSDVIGNPLDTIASGPTTPDPTTFGQAINILKKFELWETAPSSIRQHLQKGLAGAIPETPKPSDKIFQKTHTVVIGDIKLACESIKKAAVQKGFQSYLHSYEITGEARHIGEKFLEEAKKIYNKYIHKKNKPFLLIGGGETTVTVKGDGIGGRCQEMGLAIISKLIKLPGIVFAAIGTDGIDGFTDAAGVIIDEHSTQLMKQYQLNPDKFLQDNDSHNFFKNLGDSLIFTGPTGTNLNDIILIGIF